MNNNNKNNNNNLVYPRALITESILLSVSSSPPLGRSPQRTEIIVIISPRLRFHRTVYPRLFEIDSYYRCTLDSRDAASSLRREARIILSFVSRVTATTSRLILSESGPGHLSTQCKPGEFRRGSSRAALARPRSNRSGYECSYENSARRARLSLVNSARHPLRRLCALSSANG